MKVQGVVLCRICQNDTFRLVVPSFTPNSTVVHSFSECTNCGEWFRTFSSKDIRKLKLKKEIE